MGTSLPAHPQQMLRRITPQDAGPHLRSELSRLSLPTCYAPSCTRWWNCLDFRFQCSGKNDNYNIEASQIAALKTSLSKQLQSHSIIQLEITSPTEAPESRSSQLRAQSSVKARAEAPHNKVPDCPGAGYLLQLPSRICGNVSLSGNQTEAL